MSKRARSPDNNDAVNERPVVSRVAHPNVYILSLLTLFLRNAL
jgi:hypothetical protein